MKDDDTNETVFEPDNDAPENPDLEEVEASVNDKIKKLREELQTCNSERKQTLEDNQRLKADFLNTKRRLEQDKSHQIEKQEIKDIEKLLPLCDSFSMAMNDKEAWNAVEESWRKGIEGIHSQLESILESYNVQTITPVGQEFDPERHQALTKVTVADKNQNNIVQSVVQNGFVRKIDDTEQLIRPASVTVGVYEPES